MPRVCSVCRHGERQAIDRALIAGETFRYVSQRWGLSLAALVRHRDDHLPVALRKAAEAQGLADALDLVAQLKAVNSAAFTVLQEARQTGDGELALKAINTVVKQLEMVARAGGALPEAPTVNLYVLPEFVEARVVLLRALLPYPDARAAAAEALLALEGAGDRRN